MKKDSKQFLQRLAAVLLLGAGLAACAEDDLAGTPAGEPLLQGRYALEMTASQEGIRFLSAGKDSWTGGEEIGVRMGNSGTPARYVIGSGNTVRPATPDQTLYWQTDAAADITAWYPYGAQTDVDITDQRNGSQAFDWMLAAAPAQSYMHPTTLAFRHQMAKVTCTLAKGMGITDSDLAAATVQMAGHTRASFAEGVLTGEGEGWITADADREALLVPQAVGTDKPFLKVSTGGNDFFFTPAAELTLEAGNVYAYTITVKADGIEVTEATGGRWGDGGREDVGVETVPQPGAGIDTPVYGALSMRGGYVEDWSKDYSVCRVRSVFGLLGRAEFPLTV